jgi:hypothetical protein
MIDIERLKPGGAADQERRRIERSIASLIVDESSQGNVPMARLDHVRLAALRFAYDATPEQHRRLTDFDNRREQRPVSAVLVAEAVYGDQRRAEALKELFGVADPTDNEADFFVSNVVADAWALQHGE